MMDSEVPFTNLLRCNHHWPFCHALTLTRLCGVWIIGQGGDGCADSTHAVLVSQVTAR